MRLAKKVAAIDLYSISGGYVRFKDATNTIHTIPIAGKGFDLAGRLIGKVIGYDKRNRYWVAFGNGYEYQIKTRDCFDPQLNNDTFFPADLWSANTSVAYNMWWDSKLVRGYIYSPKRRRLNLSEYSARIDVNGCSTYGCAKQDESGKLYFVPNSN